jgi:hypothetical protein
MTTAELLSFYAPGTTFADLLWDCADDTDQVTYAIAYEAAELHGLDVLTAFIQEYGSALNWTDCGVDAGELLHWLGS